ncbi:type II toxin-antitoxin system prevent-host-death family antitoxin [soil metagenome]
MEVGAYEAKTNLSRLLERVEQGEKITLTRHGRPVAMLVPVEKRRSPKEVVRDLREFRGERELGDISLREMIEEGRRL